MVFGEYFTQKKIVALHGHSGKHRLLAHRLKDATDDIALQSVAEEMAEHIPEGSILVPVPSSHGVNKSILVLAQNIATLVPNSVAVEAVVRKYAVESAHLLRLAGKPPLSVDEQIASMELATDISLGENIVVIDNTVTSGTQIKAVETVLGRPITAIVYTDGSRGRLETKNPSELVICISGSRGYLDLGKIDELIKTIPAGAVIIHGGADGVDNYANSAAKTVGFHVEAFPANWKRYGRNAGPMRNREMVSRCDYLIAFWDGISRGTASTIKAAKDIGVPYEVILDS